MTTEITVQIDSREQRPLPFPGYIEVNSERLTGGKRGVVKVHTETVELPYGDYRLKSAPRGAVVERKASKDELIKNMFDPTDMRRACRAFRRLQLNSSHPILLLEISLHELFKPASFAAVDYTGGEVMSRLGILSRFYGLSLLWVPRTSNRVLVGTVIAEILFAFLPEKT